MWRLAFFSRLEERKGIKLFVDAVGSLNVTSDRFEVRCSLRERALEAAAGGFQGCKERLSG